MRTAAAIFLASCSVLLLGGTFAAATSLDVNAVVADVAAAKGVHTPLGLAGDGDALRADASRQLTAASSAAMEALRKKDQRRVVLESATFVRTGGVVKGLGVFWDGRGPRPLSLFVDAYGSNGGVIASFPYRFTSTGDRQQLAVAASDDPRFVQFGFRFAEGSTELELASVAEDSLAVAAVSPMAMLFHSDYEELVDLLADAGYPSSTSEPIAIFGSVSRFRKAYAIEGPGFVTLLDLFLLRSATGQTSGRIDFLPYVEWGSSLGGGRAVERPQYVPVYFEDVEARYLDDVYPN